MQWTILTWLHQTLWKITLVLKGLKNPFSDFGPCKRFRDNCIQNFLFLRYIVDFTVKILFIASDSEIKCASWEFSGSSLIPRHCVVSLSKKLLPRSMLTLRPNLSEGSFVQLPQPMLTLRPKLYSKFSFMEAYLQIHCIWSEIYFYDMNMGLYPAIYLPKWKFEYGSF